MDWSKLPDIVAIGLLALAFASVARQNYTRSSGLWLTGWLLIVLHFGSFLFLPAPKIWGELADVAGLLSLVWAGILFMLAAVPYPEESSTRRMLPVLIVTNTFYVCVLSLAPIHWMLIAAACLLAAGPLGVALSALPRFQHPLRWITVIAYAALAAFLLLVQQRPSDGADLALNGVLFTVYMDCCIHFWYRYRHATTGAFITISGFFLWALVFVAGPIQAAYFPAAHIESEVWNLPKFVVGIGMILLLLEEQIEHNKHLALHDVLTGLPNRRLFQDRLANALERARRAETQAALLVFDLDRFKQVNDSMGHHVGDLLLQEVAKLFSGRVRKSDTVARTGGDEFTVILEAPTSTADALHVGRSLQAMLKEPLSLETRSVVIGASFGVAVFPDDAEEMEALCIAADLRMYEHKRTGEVVDTRSDATERRPPAPSTKRRKKNGTHSR